MKNLSFDVTSPSNFSVQSMTVIVTVFTVAATLGFGGIGCKGSEPPLTDIAVANGHAVNHPMPSLPPAPVAVRGNATDLLHGVEVPDPYRQLEDPTTPSSSAWIAGQDQAARSWLSQTADQAPIAKRLAELMYVDRVGAPVVRAGRHFFSKRHKDKEKAVIYWRADATAAAQVLIDPNTMSSDGSVSVGAWYPSWDGRYVAFKRKANNADESVMVIREVDTQQDSTVDHIKHAKYAYAAWTPDSSGFYYTYLPDKDASGAVIAASVRPGWADIRFHKLGTPQTQDQLVFPRSGSSRTFLWPQLSRDGKHLFVYVQHGWNSSDVWFTALEAADKPPKAKLPADDAIVGTEPLDWIASQAKQLGFRPLAVGRDANVAVTTHEGRFYLHTDLDAPRSQVFGVAPDRPEREAWKTIVAEDDATIEGATIVGGALVIQRIRNASSVLEIWSLDGAKLREIRLPGMGSVDGLRGNVDSDDIYFTFSSFLHPPEVWRASVSTGETQRFAGLDLPINSDAFEVHQVWFNSKDDTPVSMFITHKKGLKLSGDHPTLLYGYGGFNVNMTPTFSAANLVWLERGGVYAMPNLRGGGEYGEAWHRAGMGANKQNVFDDFIGAAQYLIKTGYTSPQKLAIRGGSNGGLLVGAAMTQRPELFRAVICAVPLLDMVRYHLFGSGRTWIPEYGSAEDAAQFKTLHAYSPYHRVQAGSRYPAMLMMAADSDDRVDPMHARKFTAMVQWAQGSAAAERPILMRVEKNAGHGGADLVSQTVSSYADQWAFLLDQLR